MNKHTRQYKFTVGERVLLNTKNLRFPGNPKFKQRYAGPFKVLEQVSDVNYMLELPD